MINSNRVNNPIEELTTIGKTKNGGITRFSYTATERKANELVKAYMEAAGLTGEEDLVENVIGSGDGKGTSPCYHHWLSY